MFGLDVFSVCFCLFVKGSQWTLFISLLSSVRSIWRLSVRSFFTFSVVSAPVSLFWPSGSLAPEIIRQDHLEYCLRWSSSLASSSLLHFDKSASLCYSWASCSKLFMQFVRFWIFWSWIWIININSSLECCCNSMLFEATDTFVCWSDDNVGGLFWVLILLALFPFDLLLLAIFTLDFLDKILIHWFVWLVMILAARVVSTHVLFRHVQFRQIN